MPTRCSTSPSCCCAPPPTNLGWRRWSSPRSGPVAATSPNLATPWCFGELRELLADAGIDLLDWFVVADGFATSLAELSEATWLWRTPPDDRPG